MNNDADAPLEEIVRTLNQAAGRLKSVHPNAGRDAEAMLRRWAAVDPLAPEYVRNQAAWAAAALHRAALRLPGARPSAAVLAEHFGVPVATLNAASRALDAAVPRRGRARGKPRTVWVREAPREPAPVYQLRAALMDVEPPVWRRLQVPGDMSLDRLHLVLQAAFGWQNYHLWSFGGRGGNYGPPGAAGEMGMRSAARTTLVGVAPRAGDRLLYTYDYGDSWEHEILVEQILPPDPKLRHPVCLDGARAGPPEDCGGSWGYENFLEIIGDPEHPEHAEMLEWVGGPFNPEAWDRGMVNRELRGIR